MAYRKKSTKQLNKKRRGWKAKRSSKGKRYLVKTIGRTKAVRFRKGKRMITRKYKIKNPGRRK